MIAIDVPNIMADPMPCMTLKARRVSTDGAIVHRAVAAEKTHIPLRNSHLRPRLSAILPKGTKNAAAARRYAFAIQLAAIVETENSSAIVGSATTIELARNGVRKALIMVIVRATRLSVIV